MIRKFETKDLLEVMELWLSTNIRAHDFISRDYSNQSVEGSRG